MCCAKAYEPCTGWKWYMEPLVNKITEGGKGTANAEQLFKKGEVPLDWKESQIAIATNNFGAYSGETGPYPEMVKIFKNFLQYPDCKTAAGTMQCEKLAKYCLVQACSAKPKPDSMLKTCAAALDKDASISTLPSQAAPAAHAAGTGTTASEEGGGSSCKAVLKSAFASAFYESPVPKINAFGDPTPKDALKSKIDEAIAFPAKFANEKMNGGGPGGLEMVKRTQKNLLKDLKKLGVKATFTEDMKTVDCEVIADGFEKDGSSSGGVSEGGNAFLDESSAGLRGSGNHHHRHHHHKHGRHYHDNRQHHDAAGGIRGLRFKGDTAVTVAPLALVGEQASEMENAIKGLLIREGHGDCTKAIAMGRVSTEERRALLPPECVCVVCVCCIVIR